MVEEILRNVWPLIVIQVGLQVFALINLSKRRQVRFDNKWIWVLIIVFGGFLGSLAYFYFKGEDYEDRSED